MSYMRSSLQSREWWRSSRWVRNALAGLCGKSRRNQHGNAQPGAAGLVVVWHDLLLKDTPKQENVDPDQVDVMHLAIASTPNAGHHVAVRSILCRC